MEKINLDSAQMDYLITTANGCEKRLLRMLDYVKHGIDNYSTSYDNIITEIGELIMQPDLRNIVYIRDMLYNIMITTISGTNIIQGIMEFMLGRLTDPEKHSMIIEHSASFEHHLLLGRRDINHLGEFIINIFDVIHRSNKKFADSLFKSSGKKTKKVSKK